MDRPTSEAFITIPEAARRGGFGGRQLRRAIDRGELRVFDIGGWPRVRWSDVVAWVESKRRLGKVGPSRRRDAPEDGQ